MGVGHFVWMGWAEWTGGAVPSDVREDLYRALPRGLGPEAERSGTAARETQPEEET